MNRNIFYFREMLTETPVEKCCHELAHIISVAEPLEGNRDLGYEGN
jgi:hypothetical protein